MWVESGGRDAGRRIDVAGREMRTFGKSDGYSCLDRFSQTN